MLNLKTRGVSPIAYFNVLGANGEPQLGEDGRPCRIRYHSPASREYAEAQAIAQNAVVDMLKTDGSTSQSADEKLERQAEFLAAITIEFENWCYIVDGEEAPRPGKEQFLAAFRDRSIGYVPEKFQAHAAKWGNASKPSPTS